MSYTIYNLIKGDEELVLHLAPEDMLEELKFVNRDAFFAVEDESHTPCGLLIYSKEKNMRLDILWINVFETYRFKGVGSLLMKKIFMTAQDMDIPFVGLKLTGEMVSEENIKAISHFADDWGFTYGHFAEGDWEFTPAEYDAADIAKGKADTKSVTFAANVSEDEISRFIDKNRNRMKEAPYFNKAYIMKNYDRGHSLVYRDEDGIGGLLLTQTAGHTVYPLLFDADDDKKQLPLFLKMLRTTFKADRKDYRCHVMYTENSKNIITGIFKDKCAIPTYLFTAESGFLKEERRNARRDKSESTPIFGEDAPKEYRWLKNEYYGDF